MLDFDDCSKVKQDSTFWSKSNKYLSSLNISDGNSEGKNAFKKVKSRNSSTLSLHIAAYENSNETVASNASGEESMVKKWKKAKQIFTGLPSAIQVIFNILLIFLSCEKFTEFFGIPKTTRK